MSDIRVIVDEQTLQIINAPTIASQGVNEDRVLFEFDASWDAYGKIALFYHEADPDTIYQAAVDNTGVAVIPWEVTHDDGRIYFGVAGTNGDTVYTSELLSYRIVKGLYTVGSESIIPTPDVYAQILALLGQLNYNVNSYQSDVEESIGVISSRLDAFVADHAGIYGETVLWDSETAPETMSGNVKLVTLSDDSNDYDFIDMYFGDHIKTTTGEKFAGYYQTFFEPYYDGSASPTDTTLSFNKWFFKPHGTSEPDGVHFGIEYDKTWKWTGKTTNNAEYLNIQVSGWPIEKIVGRKLVSDAEIVDLRTGADGVVYQTAGAAVRAQIEALEDQIEGGGVTCTDTNLDGNIVISAGL